MKLEMSTNVLSTIKIIDQTKEIYNSVLLESKTTSGLTRLEENYPRLQHRFSHKCHTRFAD